MIIAQHAIPEDTNEITQVRDLLDPADLAGAVVTGDAAHVQRETARYIAGPAKDGGRESDYFLFVKGTQPGLQRAVYEAHPGRLPTRAGPHRDRLPPRPDHQAIPVVTDAAGMISRTSPGPSGSAATATMPSVP